MTALGDTEGLAADGVGEVFAGALAEAEGFGVGLGDGVVPVGVQPARSAAAMIIERVSAISFFIKLFSLH